ncbi:UNVERIFIED_CONTAM: hypothetical protein K2H54_017260 [Gekko kuhli]
MRKCTTICTDPKFAKVDATPRSLCKHDFGTDSLPSPHDLSPFGYPRNCCLCCRGREPVQAEHRAEMLLKYQPLGFARWLFRMLCPAKGKNKKTIKTGKKGGTPSLWHWVF